MSNDRFYVYEHVRKDTGAVFYVGKGSGKRAHHFVNRGKYWNNVSKSKENVDVRFVVKNVDEELSFLAEMELIDLYRRTGVKLVNISTGGEGAAGWIPTEETRKKIGEANKHTPKASGKKHGMFGKKHTAESLAKMSASQKGRMTGEKHPFFGKKHTQESLKKMSANRKGKMTGVDNPFYGKTHTDEARQKMSEACKQRKVSDETRKKLSKFQQENAHKNKTTKPVLCLTNNIKYYGLNDASKQLGLHRQAIRMVCNGKLQQTGGYKFIWSEK